MKLYYGNSILFPHCLLPDIAFMFVLCPNCIEIVLEPFKKYTDFWNLCDQKGVGFLKFFKYHFRASIL